MHIGSCVLGMDPRGKVARGSVDRTAYSPKYSLSFMSHHAERISLSVVRGVNRAIRSHLATLSARLARA